MTPIQQFRWPGCNAVSGIDRMRRGLLLSPVPRYQISEPSPEKPMALTVDRRSASCLPCVRLVKRPVPTWLNQRSNGPSRSERNVTNLPSGEMAASVSSPGKSVTRVKRPLASGFSTGAGACRRPSHHTAGSASTRAAAAIGHPTPFRDATATPALILGSDFVSHARWKRRKSRARSSACW